ncbi:putative restriction endonuclease [Anaerosporobacter mobilis DSM 15930]|jgi:putative restriction endonuclease|uniref:Putative restriction endonuclease n=1 Tax=Anaerosporobacter mobilis DSM 15930 TaxID=1120996 RepID=A0A1M7M1N8_9FIRM|nr:HNH endonuclease [Anaerosporobacter mobilis]SHM84596.1 putative restriction endonuclease [Anaerosporobacter mobilis DSM 15930]
MSERITWKDELIEVLKELDGYGHYSDIYDKIQERNRVSGLSKPSWKQTICKIIEDNSIDSDNFKGNNIFYSVFGKGKGYWGLNEYTPSNDETDAIFDDISYKEGKKIIKQHICRERNPKVIKKAKEIFLINHNNTLYCEACGFRFTDKYVVSDEFIEGHHIIPISELIEDSETRPEDIVMLCSNCHRMIHKIRPWLKKDELQKLFK